MLYKAFDCFRTFFFTANSIDQAIDIVWQEWQRSEGKHEVWFTPYVDDREEDDYHFLMVVA